MLFKSFIFMQRLTTAEDKEILARILSEREQANQDLYLQTIVEKCQTTASLKHNVK